MNALPPGTRGARRLREALALVRPGTDSCMETRLRLLLCRSGLPCPMVNQPVLAVDGRIVARPDLSYSDQRIAIEYDGDIHRTDRATWHRDIARRRAFDSLGWRIITCTATDVLNPTPLLVSIHRARAEAARMHAS